MKMAMMEKVMVRMVVVVMVMAATPTMAQRMRIPGESGPQVVEAVVDQVRSSCVLPQDNLLLRRLAYVESLDGTDPDTYRIGFDGGIWQVTRAMYDLTKSAADLQEARTAIRVNLGIDWSATHWSDLRAPLFSGLAAALYIRHSLGGHPSPVGVQEQQHFWSTVYHQQVSGSMDNKYSSRVNIMQRGCRGQALMDIVFVVDTSSSISDDDFHASTAFILNTTSQLDLTQGHTRVAVITYSTHAHLAVPWGSQQTQAELTKAINGLSYERGGTETDEALDSARTIFTGQGRSNALKVLVLITDGESHDTIDTGHAADRLTAAVPGILVLAVGVGSQVNDGELHSIATTPACTHVFRVDTYDQISALVEEILRITCRAPVILHPGQTVSCSENTCPPYMVEQPPGTKIMLKLSTDCQNGNQLLYGSPTTLYPTQGNAVINYTLSSGGLGAIYLPRNYNLNSTTFYNMAVAMGARDHCHISLHSVLDVIQVLCIEGGQSRNCTPTDIINYKRDTGRNLCP